MRGNYRHGTTHSNKKYFEKNCSKERYFKNFLHFTNFFISCYSIIDSSYYLPYKKLIKTKIFYTISGHIKMIIIMILKIEII